MVEEYEDMIQFQQRFLTQKRKGKLRTPIIKGSGRLLGLIIQDDIILGANTRTIEGPIITEKNCEKIHYMAPNIYCCGAGTAADTKAITVHNCNCIATIWVKNQGCHSTHPHEESPF
ncbi:proteasome subunit beta type-7-A-like isoform X2 [Carya illinoinensis]|uniref:proteasome subunit beta type-7-A-like isoform X2 n=1 Tax=Carya illinoinensis TaxID=32201 RepID=UPI001C71AE7D|nr:proteasome subunit beta type-7-A-like isoform X2 [Carya illinoinensis]XP_042965079.1 proteasome subunit beta type-7-A-like isoform X2 [Carya illinoinensis]